MTRRWIRLGLFDRPSSQARAKLECCKSRDYCGTAQPPASHPEALRVTSHGQRAASLEGLNSLQRFSRGILLSHPTDQNSISKLMCWVSGFLALKSVFFINLWQVNITNLFASSKNFFWYIDVEDVLSFQQDCHCFFVNKFIPFNDG